VADNEVAPEPVTSAHVDTSPFGRAMIGVNTKCRELAAAIEAHDFEGVVIIAREATNMWFTGRSGCRRLVESSTTSSPHSDAARRLLEETYMRLLELFEHAARTIDVPRMRRVLGELRVALVTAIAQPLSGGDRPDNRARSSKGAS
jgi:hypothetical protein